MKALRGRYWHFFDDLSVSDGAEIRLWVALPPDHRGQEVTIGGIHPHPEEIIEDETNRNRIVFWRLTDFFGGNENYCSYDFEFAREPVLVGIDPEAIGEYDRESEEYLRYTRSEPWIEITDDIRKKARETASGVKNPYHRALKVFDWILDNMVYEYPDPAHRGAAKSFASLKGDCGEFSFVFCAMCRSLGIPARTVTCMWLTDAGHNWAEILLPGYGWVPADLSVAQGLAGNSKAFPDNDSMTAFAKSRGIPSTDPHWLLGNLYPERLIISVGNNIEVNHSASGITKTFRFMQPGGSGAIPPAIESSGFKKPPVEAGFFLFGDGSEDLSRARETALVKMVPGYMAAGSYDKAEMGLMKKLESQPDNSQALFDLGQCRLNRGMFDEAITAFEKSLSGSGGSTKPVLDIWSHNLLGLCHKSKGNMEKTREEFRFVIESGVDFQGSLQFARDNLQGCEQDSPCDPTRSFL
jgi:hypothetical protein